MIRLKVQLLLNARAGGSVEFEQALSVEADRLSAILPAGAGIVAAGHLGNELLADTAYSRLFADSPPPFDGFIGATNVDGHDMLADALAGSAQNLGPLIDVATSRVVAGSEHMIIPGDTATLYTLAFRHPPSIPRAQACAHWRNEHVKFALAPDPDQLMRGYRQFHVEEEVSRRAAARIGLGYDDLTGIVEVYCRSGEEMAARLRFPQIETLVIPDERNFIDHSRSRGTFYKVAAH